MKAGIDDLRNRLHLHAAFQRVFANPELPDGKIVLDYICKEGFITKSTFVAGDPHQTAMNEGSRRLVLSILRFVHRDHEELIKRVEEMIRET